MAEYREGDETLYVIGTADPTGSRLVVLTALTERK